MTKDIMKIITDLDNKKTNGYDLDPVLIRELTIFGENDREIYNRKMAFVENYRKKKEKGRYNRKMAIKGIANNIVPEIAKKYRKNFSLPRVSMENKVAVAIDIVNEIEMEYL